MVACHNHTTIRDLLRITCQHQHHWASVIIKEEEVIKLISNSLPFQGPMEIEASSSSTLKALELKRTIIILRCTNKGSSLPLLATSIITEVEATLCNMMIWQLQLVEVVVASIAIIMIEATLPQGDILSSLIISQALLSSSSGLLEIARQTTTCLTRSRSWR